MLLGSSTFTLIHDLLLKQEVWRITFAFHSYHKCQCFIHESVISVVFVLRCLNLFFTRFLILFKTIFLASDTFSCQHFLLYASIRCHYVFVWLSQFDVLFSRFGLDIDLDAPKVRIPLTANQPSLGNEYFVLDFGHFTLHTRVSSWPQSMSYC